MINPEAIFTFVFVAVLLAIPFAIGMNLSRALRNRREIKSLISEAKHSSGRVVGYTKRRYDSESIGQYYPIFEYKTDDGHLLWAEGQSCDIDEYPINSSIELMFHPRDKRDVAFVVTQNLMQMRMNFEKNLGVSFNIFATIFLIACIVYYKKYEPVHLIALTLSYAIGLIFGVILSTEKADERLRVQSSENRNRRLVAAQKKYVIPCYLEE
ncbi:hypothetical protein [Litorimonas cladophorae]|nr:hypothetical protein [Litorimonas cladophorae]